MADPLCSASVDELNHDGGGLGETEYDESGVSDTDIDYESLAMQTLNSEEEFLEFMEESKEEVSLALFKFLQSMTHFGFGLLVCG